MKRLLFTFIACVISITGIYAQEQGKEMTERYFPMPEDRYETPTLLIKEDRFADYEEIMAWIGKKMSEYGNLKYEIIGKTPGGYEIPLIMFADPENAETDGRIKVWMQGCIHGNEPAAAESLFQLVNYLLEDRNGKEMLKYLDIRILPIANMDGYFRQQRRSADGFDLNRDQTKFSDDISKIIKTAFIAFDPDVAFDFHEYQPIRKEISHIGTKGASLYYDVLFLPTGHRNVPEVLRKASLEIYQKSAEKALDDINYTHSFYFSIKNTPENIILVKGAKSPQSSSTSYALSNAISMLVELRGINLGRLCLERRTKAGFTVARTFLEETAKNRNEIRKTVDKAIDETVGRKNDIYVKGVSKDTVLTVKFIDMATNELKDITAPVEDGLELKATLTRKRPEAYILDASCVKAAENLKILGVKTYCLERDTVFTVETYKVTDYNESPKEWEKIHTVKVETEVTEKEMKFPAGTIIIPTGQENGNYAVTLLEPESENGFVAFRVIETGPEKVLPIYRIN